MSASPLAPAGKTMRETGANPKGVRRKPGDLPKAFAIHLRDQRTGALSGLSAGVSCVKLYPWCRVCRPNLSV